jgi:hypothetical protein
MAYVVTAGYVTVETAVPGGRAQIDLPVGAVLPDDVPAERVQTLLGLGRIEALAEQAVREPSSPPPKRGTGSGLDAWTAYANSWGVTVPESYNRDQIRDLLAGHGIPIE